MFDLFSVPFAPVAETLRIRGTWTFCCRTELTTTSRLMNSGPVAGTLLLAFCTTMIAEEKAPATLRTAISIVDDSFHINGQPTYAGRQWRGKRIEGLLMNSRMVQGIFDDRNPETIQRWAYPDSGKWDPERNTREFIEAMPDWRKHGLLAFTINVQGGSPEGYSKIQPWHNSAFEANGSLSPDYTARLAKILDRAGELGMVAIVGLSLIHI